MPLRDHFHPPLSIQRPWEGFHGAWATSIAYQLNGGILPADYYAMPLLEVTGRVEVDVATIREGNGSASPPATAPYAPPQPSLTLPLEMASTDTFEVQVLRNFGGPQLRAAIELVSPASRRAFATKCANHLLRGVSVVIVDIVTERSFNLHAELLATLDRVETPAWNSPTALYAISYRGVLTAESQLLEAWRHELHLGEPLPELPLWLESELCVPLRQEESYTITAGNLRMCN